jgi:hypothetical protein
MTATSDMREYGAVRMNSHHLNHDETTYRP